MSVLDGEFYVDDEWGGGGYFFIGGRCIAFSALCEQAQSALRAAGKGRARQEGECEHCGDADPEHGGCLSLHIGANLVTWVSNGIEGAEGWHDEFLEWYKPSEWFGGHRAACAFLAGKFQDMARVAGRPPEEGESRE